MIHLPDITTCEFCRGIAALGPDEKYLEHGTKGETCIATGHTEDEAVAMRIGIDRPN